MTEPLAGRGIPTVAVALPSCGETSDVLGDLYADVDATREAVEAAEPPVVLCGHSYGGMVITEAGADKRVSQLFYVTSMMPDTGQALAEIASTVPTPWMDPGNDGTVGVHADIVRQLFLQDCDAPTQREALARLTRQSAAPFTQPPRKIAWHQTPSMYFICTEDLAIPADVQRQRARDSARKIDAPAGHHPFLSQPDAFAELIVRKIH
jgi:pimeloyl-ACP methyl ester carboxylesterase